MRQIGKDLGVRYALEGSVQPSGDRLRVNAQLIDTESDAHLWADRFDENRSDLLQMQDAIVHRIALAIGIKITDERARRAQTRAANPNAEDLAWRCSAALMRTFGRRNGILPSACASKRWRSTLRMFARCPT